MDGHERLDHIRYEIPTLVSGYVEFDVTNLRELNPRSDKRMLIMWDPTRGDYTTNPYRVHLQKMDRRTSTSTPAASLDLEGQERNIGHDFTDWNPERIYRFRLEWGDFPGVDTEWVRVLLDGVEILTRNYDFPYAPSTHFVELGCAPRNEPLEEAIFSNVRIGTRCEQTAPRLFDEPRSARSPSTGFAVRPPSLRAVPR
jgi:hypothetical protein